MERPLTKNIRADRTPLTFDEYVRVDGYEALRQAVKLQPQEITARVVSANLRGMGGAGFPTGRKWSAMPMGEDVARPKYLVINADEMEPGTFKDRLLMEGDPHLLIEGMLVSAYALQADVGYIFLRAEYKKSERHLRRAIAEAYEQGLLGADVYGSGWRFDIHLHISAGRYICGEASALLNALEGRRAIPRAKGVRTAVSGLWGRPTMVNNVETICNVPGIVRNGAEWFKSLSRSAAGGTKLYGASGKLRNAGIWELPMGTPMREIIEEHGGGLREGLRLRAVLPGGVSTEFVREQDADVAMDWDSMPAVGSRLGTGTLIVFDDHTCPVAMLKNIMHFFAQESCGWCTPCREGLPWVVTLLSAIEEGTATEDAVAELAAHVHLLGPGNTFCGLAPGAMEPLGSGLKYFADDIARHIRERRCPWSH